MQITYYIFMLNINLFPGKIFYLKPNAGGFQNDLLLRDLHLYVLHTCQSRGGYLDYPSQSLLRLES